MILRVRSFLVAVAWSVISIVVGPAAFARTGPDQAATRTDPTFADVLKALHGTTFRHQLGDLEDYANWQRANIFDQESAVPAIYQLWVLDRRDAVQLLWWQKDDRLSRVFIDMLFYCAVGEEGERMSSFPSLNPRRYASPEREQRLAEIAWVRAHRSALARELVLIFMPAAEITPMYQRYMDIAAANDGSSLPTSGLELLFPQ